MGVVKKKKGTYGLTPEFERQFAMLAATDPAFVTYFMPELDPSLFEQKAVKRLLEVVKQYVLLFGEGPQNVTLLQQRARKLMADGKISEEDRREIVDLTFDAELEGPDLPEEQIRQEMRAVLKSRLEEQGLEAHSKAYGAENSDGYEEALRLIERSRTIGQIPQYDGVTSLSGSIDQILEHLETGRLSTGVTELDDELQGGLVYGGFGLFAGPTGVGKSNALVQVLGNNYWTNVPTLYITFEMRTREVMQRLISGLSRIPMHDWRRKGEEVKARADEIQARGHNGYIRVIERQPFEVSVREVDQMIRAHEEVTGFRPVCILLDMMDKMVPKSGSKNSEWQNLKTVAIELKAWANKHEICVWSGAQTKANAKKLEGTDAVGGSIALAQNCDLMVRMDRVDADDPEGHLKLEVVKARQDRRSVHEVPSHAEYGHLTAYPFAEELKWE